MNNQKFSVLNNKLSNHIRKRALYFIGLIFIYILPIAYVLKHIKVITKVETTSTTSVSITWCIVGILYLLFVAKFFRKKISNMQPKPIKTFFQGISSLIPVTVLGAFIHVIQNVINKIPNIDIAQYIWNVVILIATGLCLQIIDSVINRKYLYDLEISKQAKKQIDIENKKNELIKARKELE